MPNSSGIDGIDVEGLVCGLCWLRVVAVLLFEGDAVLADFTVGDGL